MSFPLAEPEPLAPGTLRVTPLGGLGEVGRNMTTFEYEGKILIVDCGVLFPEEHHPGVDLILPDFGPIEDRLDDIVVFHPLDKQQIKQIARIQMRGLEKRLAERGLKLAVSDAAFDLLGNVGFDPVYGARPLKRAIQSQLENPLAQQILSGAFVNGDTIEVGNDGGRLVFAKA